MTSESATESGPTKALPNLTPKEGIFSLILVDIPGNIASLLKGYSFIFGIDDPNKDFPVPDAFDSYEVALLIYKNITKSDKVGRVALDFREFGWKCGPKKPCQVGELYSNVTGNDLDVNALKSQINAFMSKINGISKVCMGDTYTDPEDKKRALVFCFNSQDDINKFVGLTNYLNTHDLNSTSAAYDPETEQTFDVHFSDGH
jgi:hypothetical protein